MTELTIIKPNVRFFDGGKTHRPDEGAVVTVLSKSIVRSLVKTGLAAEGRTLPIAPESLEAPQGVAPSPGSDDTGGSEKGGENPTWADVTGLSKPALALLETNASDADPLTASPELILVWLEESERRAALVVNALAKWKAARSTGSGGDG